MFLNGRRPQLFSISLVSGVASVADAASAAGAAGVAVVAGVTWNIFPKDHQAQNKCFDAFSSCWSPNTMHRMQCIAYNA